MTSQIHVVSPVPGRIIVFILHVSPDEMNSLGTEFWYQMTRHFSLLDSIDLICNVPCRRLIPSPAYYNMPMHIYINYSLQGFCCYCFPNILYGVQPCIRMVMCICSCTHA